MAFLTRSTFVAATVAFALAVEANVAPATPEQVRSELASYFKNIDRNSPTVLGGLAKSPDAMKAIQERITGMSDEEAAKFQKLLADTPDWKVAPEAFAAGFPPEMLQQIQRVGGDYTAEVPKGERMRDDARTLVEILKLLPQSKLQQLNITPEMVTSLDATFDEMSPLQAAMLHRNAATGPEFGAKSALAIQTLPPSLRRGANALAQHGPLTEADVAELKQFRNELVRVLIRIEDLPEAARAKLNVGVLEGKAKQLAAASPEALFMIRNAIPDSMLASLQKNVAMLERFSSFTPEERAKLDRFREELAAALKNGADAEKVEAMLAELGPEHLFVLEKRMESYGGWQTALPAFYQTLAAPELADRVRAVSGTTANPAAVASLEAFRSAALSWIDAVATDPSFDAHLVARARQTLASATPDRLEMMRMTAERLPATATENDKLGIVLMHEINFGCSINFQVSPEICTPEICVDPTGVIPCIPAGCIPAVRVDINLDFICNPIEDALETIEHGITGVANAALDTMSSGINTAITAVQNTINNAIAAVNNVINTTISAITNTIDDIWTFLQTIPDRAWNAIKAALNLLLDIQIRNGVTVRDLVARGAEHALTSMRTLLGMAGDWWTAVSTFTLPAIPCPPTGFHTPFGNVGDGAAADNYGRYRLVIDGIIEMIPDTETSLAIKIPAQILYMAYDFLGLCLEQAAADADSALAESRHSLVVTSFANLQSYIGTSVAGLAAASGSQTNTILALINAQSSNVQNTINAEGAIIRSLINTETASTETVINQESTTIQSLLQRESDDTQEDIASFRELNLRLTIERVLQGNGNSEIGSFQLRAPWGHLARVAEIVNETIEAMTTAQETIGQARRYYSDGLQLMAAGKDKEAFRAFAQAYRETTK